MDITRIEAAAERLRGHARVTPLLSSPFLDEIAGKRLFIKPECLQHTGSFKYRGARSALSALPEAVRARGVIARKPTVHSTPTTVTASIPPRHEDASATGRARSRPERPPRVVPAM